MKTLPENVERNWLILEALRSRKQSYSIIAWTFGVSRSTVAGIAFRDRHPPSGRVASPRGNGGNKAGTGWQPATYEPRLTARTHSVPSR